MRSPEYLIFNSLLHKCEKELNFFEHHIFIENFADRNTSDIVNKGMLSIQTILSDTSGNGNVIYYLSGPQKMISSFRRELIVNNILENTTNPVVVKFTADWCGPCKRIAPLFEEFAGSCENCSFYKVNVDNNQECAEQCEVTCMPTFLLFKNGKCVDRVEGANMDAVKTLVNKEII